MPASARNWKGERNYEDIYNGTEESGIQNRAWLYAADRAEGKKDVKKLVETAVELGDNFLIMRIFMTADRRSVFGECAFRQDFGSRSQFKLKCAIPTRMLPMIFL